MRDRDYDPMVEESVEEEPEEILGDPIDVKGTVFPRMMQVHLEINGFIFDVSIPYNSFGDIENTVAIFPQAFQAVLEGAAEQGREAEHG